MKLAIYNFKKSEGFLQEDQIYQVWALHEGFDLESDKIVMVTTVFTEGIYNEFSKEFVKDDKHYKVSTKCANTIPKNISFPLRLNTFKKDKNGEMECRWAVKKCDFLFEE
ncbi:MAG TPA: hypothetical protein P5230_01870 [Candidatus Magasanikbacteria bacterium]|nr:hypothetical protein [Candidatus Magasanikbacteria bacterium]